MFASAGRRRQGSDWLDRPARWRVASRLQRRRRTHFPASFAGSAAARRPFDFTLLNGTIGHRRPGSPEERPGVPVNSQVPGSTGLQHSLKQSHMTMIAFGGGIGVVIQAAGPAAVLSFLITGTLVVLVMRMLGEMAAALPAVGSFYEYARLAWSDRPQLGDLAGFLCGWMYWYFWVIVVALEAVAGAALVQYWLPNLPGWLISLVL